MKFMRDTVIKMDNNEIEEVNHYISQGQYILIDSASKKEKEKQRRIILG